MIERIAISTVVILMVALPIQMCIRFYVKRKYSIEVIRHRDLFAMTILLGVLPGMLINSWRIASECLR